MKKFRIFLSLKKEEEWINSIQEEGYKLVVKGDLKMQVYGGLKM